MHLPVVFHVLGLSLPAHLVLESLAYVAGFRLYLHLRRRQQDSIDDATRLTVLIGAVVGAAFMSKALGFAEHPELWPLVMKNPVCLISAKTILGGLLGGIIGVEIAKAFNGITRSTGDIYVFPLLVAIMIGRVGCLLTGVSDGTWGTQTHFFMGFDAGDGVIRHPTPLYEILFLAVLGVALYVFKHHGFPKFLLSNFGKGARPPEPLRGKPARVEGIKNGDLFKLFIMAYCAWRFGIEFLKPVTAYAIGNNLNIVQYIATDSSLTRAGNGLSVLQIAALLGFATYATVFVRRMTATTGG